MPDDSKPLGRGTSIILHFKEDMTEFLEERRIKDLVICKDSFAEKNELREDMKTLADYGIFGAPEDKDPVSVQMYYEFKPCDHDDPLLLHMGKG